MNKAFSLALLASGIVLMIIANSFGSDVSRYFTGSPADNAIWILIGGGVVAIAGLTMTLSTSEQAKQL